MKKKLNIHKIVYRLSVSWLTFVALLIISVTILNFWPITTFGNTKNYFWAHLVDYYYNDLPQDALDIFYKEGWSIKLTEDNLGTIDDEIVIGLCVPKEKTIYLLDFIPIKDDYLPTASAILHEFGHYIDCDDKWISKSDEFMAIYQEELNSFGSLTEIGTHNTESSTEYFAEAFEWYIKNPNKLNKACPKTYKYLEDCINNFSGKIK